jgi:DNA repair and recombination protein RAD52
MSFTAEQIAALSAKLDKANVKERTQAGFALSYVEAWHVIAEANRIFGFDGWTRETLDLIQLGEPRLVDGKYRVGYRAKVRIIVDGVVREGCGFGSGIDRDPDQAHESALKEAESDAMKRAFMTFGNPFGLALYDKKKADVEDSSANKPAPPKSAAVLTACAAIDMCKSHADLDTWAVNNGEAVKAMSDDDARAVRAHFGAKQRSIREAA